MILVPVSFAESQEGMAIDRGLAAGQCNAWL